MKPFILLLLTACAAFGQESFTFTTPVVSEEMVAAAPSFTYYATAFGGASALSADMRSAWTANSKGILSFWVKFTGGDGGNVEILNDLANKVVNHSDYYLRISLYNNSDVLVMQMISTHKLSTSSGWTCVMISWDLTVPTGKMYFGDTEENASPSTAILNETVTSHYNPFRIGSTADGGDFLTGSFSEFYLDNTTYLDLAIESNRRKFLTAGGKPVDKGATGTLVTGSQPIIYLKNPYGTFQNNSGSAGNFTVIGSALANDASIP